MARRRVARALLSPAWSDGFGRFDVNSGIGYETPLSDALALRVFDVRAYLMAHLGKTPLDDDRLGRRVDVGGMLSTGLVVK